MKTYCLTPEQQIALIRTFPDAVGIRINPDHVDAGKVFDAIRDFDGELRKNRDLSQNYGRAK